MGKVSGAVVVVTAMLALAADAPAQAVSVGLKGGVGFGSLDTSGPESFDTSADAGGLAGVFLGVELGDRLRFQPELYWSVRRFAATGVPTPFSVSARGIEVPLLMQVRMPRARTSQVIVFGGPQLAVIGKVTQKIGNQSADVSDRIRNRDLALVVGAGLEHSLAKGSWAIDVRIAIGTSNVSEAGPGSQKSRGFTVLTGYRF
jgi:hypothetical protein